MVINHIKLMVTPLDMALMLEVSKNAAKRTKRKTFLRKIYLVMFANVTSTFSKKS